MDSKFQQQDLFEIVCYAASPEKASKAALWLTEKSEPFRGGFRTCYKKVHYVIIPDWPSNPRQFAGEECTIIYIDHEEDLNLIKGSDFDFSDFHSAIVLSFTKSGEDLAKQLKCMFLETTDKAKVFTACNEVYEKTVTKIKQTFDKYDKDKSGFLDSSEVLKLVAEMGENIDKEDTLKAIKAMDTDLEGKIDLQEFTDWWKIGKNKPHAVSKIYDLKKWITSLCNQVFEKNIEKLEKNAEAIEMNFVDIDVITEEFEIFDFATRVEFRLNAGEVQHTNAIRRYGSKFNNKLKFTEGNWFSIAVFTEPKTKSGKEIEHLMHELKDNLLAYAEKNWIPGASEFLEEFVTFEVQSMDNSAHLSMIFNYEIGKLIRNALFSISNVIKYVTKDNDGFSLEVILNSKENLGAAINNGVQARKMFEKAEMKFESSGDRNALREVIKAIKTEHINELSFLEYLYAPEDFTVELNGPVTELEDEPTKVLLDKSMASLAAHLQFLKDIMPDEIEEVMARFEVATSFHNLFANFEIYSSTLFSN